MQCRLFRPIPTFSRLSGFLQVLVSIQGLILVREPWYNEPGFEQMRGIKVYEDESERYTNHVYHLTLKAILHAAVSPRVRHALSLHPTFRLASSATALKALWRPDTDLDHRGLVAKDCVDGRAGTPAITIQSAEQRALREPQGENPQHLRGPAGHSLGSEAALEIGKWLALPSLSLRSSELRGRGGGTQHY